MSNYHQHYSGYVPSPPKNGHGYYYGYGGTRVSPVTGTTFARSPSPVQALKTLTGADSPSTPSPTPPISISPAPKSSCSSGEHDAPRGHGKHASKKLDNIFRHLVKWGSPGKSHHKAKDKQRHHSGPNTESSSATKPDTPAPAISISTISPTKIYSTTPTKCMPNVHHAANSYTRYWSHRRPSSTCTSDRSSYDDANNEDLGSEDDDERESTGEESGDEDEDEVDGYLKLPPAYVQRGRSKSVDWAQRKREMRDRRYSEGTPRVKDTSHQAYTIYESIINQGGRRSSVNFHRPSDACIDAAHAAILFRDARGLPHVDPFLDRHLIFGEHEENEILVKFFKFHKCYDLIPTSAKLVVFDTQLLVKKAFFALVYNGVRAAPLWDSTERKIVGMLTITDFIKVLHAMYHDSAGSTGKMSELEEHRVETWRKRFLLNRQPLVYIDPDSSLYEAICSLVNNRIHRLPVIDKHTGNVLHILTHKRILKFLFLYINEIPRPSFLNKQLKEVRIGSFDKVETAREDTPIIVALQKFLDRRVSALPIVDEENRLLSIYARFDVINLAAEKTYSNLDITLKQANEHRNEWFEGVHKCTLDETLFVVMDRIVKAEVHRLVVVDEQDRVTGVISLSDILQYLVMRPELKEITDTNLKVALQKEKSGDEAVFESLDEVHDNKSDIMIDSSISPDLTNNKDSQDPSESNENDNSDCSERENPTIFEEDDEKT